MSRGREADRWRWLLLVVGAVAVPLLVLLFWPARGSGLRAQPQPAESYEEAVRRLEMRLARETEENKLACHSFLLDHGGRVERVVVLIHGAGNCPRQVADLGQQLYEQGNNVLALALPQQGLADELSQRQAQTTAEDLARYGDEVADLAQGLGEHVTLAGFSTGGVVAAWAAQERDDVDAVVLISPGFGLGPIPPSLTRGASNLFRLLPNRFVWFDAELREDVPPAHGYSQYSTRNLAELLRLGQWVRQGAGARPLQVDSVVVVMNASDSAVHNGVTRQVVERWRRRDASKVTVDEFDASLALEHDLLDPLQPYQQVDLVYPKLMELIALAQAEP